jgi:hypothetical protein
MKFDGGRCAMLCPYCRTIVGYYRRGASAFDEKLLYRFISKYILSHRSLRTANDVAEWAQKKSSEVEPVGLRQAYPSE